MKKLLIIAVALTLNIAATAQSSKEADAAKKKIERSDAAIANVKKAAQANTWVDRATAYTDAAMAYSANLIANLPASQLNTTQGEPLNIEDVVITGAPLSKYEYARIDIYVTPEGLVSFWNIKEEAVEGALFKALEALEKAKEISAKDFTKTGKATNATDRLFNEMSTTARSSYMLGQFQKAAKDFTGAHQVMTLTGTVDTLSLYYSGICYSEGKEYAKAKKVFERLISIGSDQDGHSYHYLATATEQLGEADKAIEIFEAGFKKYPENGAIMGGLINSYMTQDKNPEKLIEIIQKAQNIDTTNVSLYLVEAQVWDKIGNKENTYKALEKAIEIEPTNIQAYYNYALFKIIASDALVAEAGKLDLNDTKTFDSMMEEVKALRISGVALLEKAFELDTEKTIDMGSLLGQMYFICRDYAPEFQTKHDQYKAKNDKASE